MENVTNPARQGRAKGARPRTDAEAEVVQGPAPCGCEPRLDSDLVVRGCSHATEPPAPVEPPWWLGL